MHRKIFSKQLALSDAESNTSGLLNRGGIADLPMLRKVTRAKFLGSDGLLCLLAYADLAALVCLNITLKLEDFPL